ANNSVRVTDEFMQAVEDDADWDLKTVTTGETVETVKAKDLFRQFAEAAWECADPGMQFDTTINDWHTTPKAGRINGSNPCSEYMHLDNSACNLASLNLLKFLNEDGSFDIEAFKHTTEVIFTAQEILVGYSEYPTESISKNAKKYRELGIGYANLGALLMAKGLPYDSDEGRAMAGAITALLTGHSYATSAKLAKQVGPFAGYHKDREGMIRVLKKHRDAVKDIDASLVSEELLTAAAEAWDEAVELGERFGVRNSQASVLAPTGTIGLMMDCDTTGIEPDLSLVKTKNLVGGGTMSIVNQTVPRALATLGYSPDQVMAIVDYIDTEKTIVGAPDLKDEHLPVFACAMGDNVIHYNGHIKMMGAVQPFLSGAISKTVNMPEAATVEDVEQLHIDSWKLGLKAVAIYRDNCKVAQPLSTTKKEGAEEAPASEPKGEPVLVNGALRRRMPKTRRSRTVQFTVADLKGYFIVGEYEDGSPGELFIWVAKQGSTLSGVMDSFGRSVSYGLQYGVPLKAYVRGMTNLSFAPSGITDDPDVRTAASIMDYIFRRMALDYLSWEDRLELGLASIDDMPDEQTTLIDTENLRVGEEPKTTDVHKPEVPLVATTATDPVLEAATKDAETKEKAKKNVEMRFTEESPLCVVCGNRTQRSGSCYVCTACGTTTGCS
ncbi:MAG: vitamin B12-dependent ribonucleotide reductase, partial [Candidatus Saccharimonadales bacterium]|nr:vitamin B12-dependent ribonucleotide reductase [Candidatus Saccharimonadales bacterium]